MRLYPCLLALSLSLATVSGCGCQNVYYGAMEKLGYEKRDLLVGRIVAARDAQEEAKEQFASALDEFLAVTGYQGGGLQAVYERLNRELERSEARAEAVRNRINEVKRVSEALFREWEAELLSFENAEYRRVSEQQLRQTRERYNDLYQAMRRAESKIEPVLRPMRDQVLFLKHNLNAQAIAAIQGELGQIEGDVGLLIRDMEAAIAEADSFIKAMDTPQG